MIDFTPPIFRLINELKKIPTIGPKSAQRICFYLMKKEKKVAFELADAIIQARNKTMLCPICFHITSQNPCEICSESKRDSSKICVVEEPFNVISIERTGLYNGLYHVLHGNLSPMRGIGPDELKIFGLLRRLENKGITEIILATSPTTEGNATAHYLTEIMRKFNIKITRIALGLPIGSDIDYADSVTIAQAIESRTEI